MDTFMQTHSGDGGGGAPYGVPAPSGVAAPQGVAMQPPGNTAAAPPAYGAPPPMPNRMAGGDFIAQGRASAPPLTPPAPTMAGVGQNGFGVHPDVSHEQIANYLLPAFKNVESSGNYAAAPPKATPGNPHPTASGAYGYINSTWNNHGGYPRAMDAPPEVQDARMKQDLISSLNRFGGDPFKTAAAHYYPKFAGDPTKWEEPPVNAYGKPIAGAQTVRQYLEKILPPERVGRYLEGVKSSG